MSSSLVKSDADLAHARASNKRLMAWKVAEMPRAEALRIQLADARSGREAVARQAQLAAGERLRLLQRQNKVPALMLLTSGASSGGGGANSPGSAASPHRASQARNRLQTLAGEGGVEAEPRLLDPPAADVAAADASDGVLHGGAAETIATLQRAWDAQRSELKAQVEELRRQVRAERDAKNQLFERIMIPGGPTSLAAAEWAAGAGGSPSGTARGGNNPARTSSPTGAFSGRPNSASNNAGSAGSAAMQLEILTRRHAELRRSSEQAVEQRDALRRALVAVRVAAPELAAALDLSSLLDTPATAPVLGAHALRTVPSPALGPVVGSRMGAQEVGAPRSLNGSPAAAEASSTASPSPRRPKSARPSRAEPEEPARSSPSFEVVSVSASRQAVSTSREGLA